MGWPFLNIPDDSLPLPTPPLSPPSSVLGPGEEAEGRQQDLLLSPNPRLQAAYY